MGRAHLEEQVEPPEKEAPLNGEAAWSSGQAPLSCPGGRALQSVLPADSSLPWDSELGGGGWGVVMVSIGDWCQLPSQTASGRPWAGRLPTAHPHG